MVARQTLDLEHLEYEVPVSGGKLRLLNDVYVGPFDGFGLIRD